MHDQSQEQNKHLLSAIGPVVPVADFIDEGHASACCEIFTQCGVPSVEVTLRRPNAWDSVRKCIELMPNAHVGIGTVIDADQLRLAKDLGAAFAISPGLSPELVLLVQELDLPYYPGIATASELMLARSMGLRAVKFFPAEAAGGIPMLKSLGSPFPDMAFCPTGGISVKNYQDYLALGNVSCVGGSWVVPSQAALAESPDTVIAGLKQVYG